MSASGMIRWTPLCPCWVDSRRRACREEGPLTRSPCSKADRQISALGQLSP